MKKILALFSVLAIGFLASGCSHQSVEIQDSEQTKETKQSLTIKGSDTELQVVSNLVEAFAQNNPNASISVTGGGSGSGIAALLNGEIELANSSRNIKEKELSQAKEKNLDVKEFILARDGLSIIVSPENEIEALTISDLGKIYRGEIINWNELGGEDTQIVLYGRQTTSGTYVFFRDMVLQADYADTMLNMEGSQAIVDAVANDANGIGYVGAGYIKEADGSAKTNIKLVKIAKDVESEAVSPLDNEKVKANLYPLTRPLFQYLANVPASASLLEKFLAFEGSAEGQEIIIKAGFFPPIQEDIEKNQTWFQK